LPDGSSIEIRALEPADRNELRSAVGRMSDQSIYRHFFSPKQTFTVPLRAEGRAQLQPDQSGARGRLPLSRL